MRSAARAANDAKINCVAYLSQEVAKPTNTILGIAELLRRTPLNEEQQRYVQAHSAAQWWIHE